MPDRVRSNVRRLCVVVALAACLLAPARTGLAVRITERVATNSGLGIAVDAYGRIWYTDGDVARFVTPWAGGPTGASGVFSHPLSGLAVDANGKVWSMNRAGSGLCLICPGCHICVLLPTASAEPTAVAAGPDAYVYFTEWAANKIGRFSQAGGMFDEYPIATAGSHPSAITSCSDGNLWFVEYDGNKLGKLTPAGAITEYPIPTTFAYPTGIACDGINGKLAFTETGQHQIGYFTISGSTFQEVPLDPTSSPDQIVFGPDGALWFTEYYGNRIGRIEGTTVTEYPLPTAAAHPRGIALGADGALWFTEEGVAKLGRLQDVVVGDVNADGVVDVTDVFYLINFLFAGGAPPK